MRCFVLMFFNLLRQYLRSERDLGELGVELSDAERAALEPAAVRPNLAVYWLTEELMKHVRAGRVTEQRYQLMDQNITALVDNWGGAERIMRTPVPFAYAQHIKSFLTLFCTTAPFAMVEAMKWYTPIAAAVLAYGMFGIDEIGVEIEDPFGDDPNDLPLDAIGAGIDRAVAEIVATPRRSALARGAAGPACAADQQRHAGRREHGQEVAVGAARAGLPRAAVPARDQPVDADHVRLGRAGGPGRERAGAVSGTGRRARPSK